MAGIRIRFSEENYSMHRLSRSAPVLLALGLALAGCNSEKNGQDKGVADPNSLGSTFRDTGANQVVLQVEGLR